ncbi:MULTISPECIES: triphosphoribosyl-dephospho-CoA synthase MdcB [Burkholderia]|uniref:triphosphoribosyl-dephospho-CoA synthase MdcB n=1 Tax=Burkholderia TaxID=32008 RepID=UPI0009F6D41C|nr:MULTISPECIES: triphosphoribosyl-dephospho-CoA synthase MdcB [unclassified Burkholderia]
MSACRCSAHAGVRLHDTQPDRMPATQPLDGAGSAYALTSPSSPAAALRDAPQRPLAATASVSAEIAAQATRCLLVEIDTWPKPGLVSHVDSGSHDDMSADTFRRSAAALRPFFAELADAGARDANMAALRRIGLRAESAMLDATHGVNTHRGAIFGLGLLCAAAGLRAASHVPHRAAAPLGAIVAERWGAAIVRGPRALDSHGECASRRYGVGGARAEAAGGFPSVYTLGVHALADAAQLAPGNPEAARVHACFVLIAGIDDTNLLHRGGLDGLVFAQRTARDFLARGGVGAIDWHSRAVAAHRAFVARRLSPGGAADLLAMSLFVAAYDGSRLRAAPPIEPPWPTRANRRQPERSATVRTPPDRARGVQAEVSADRRRPQRRTEPSR